MTRHLNGTTRYNAMFTLMAYHNYVIDINHCSMHVVMYSEYVKA